MNTSWGTAAETLASNVVADWGIPDFVYAPRNVATGSGNVEVSDGVLAVGERGLMLQVKARQPDANPERLAKWIDKQTKKAAAQMSGSRRTLSRETVGMESRRGYERDFGPLIEPWAGVIILDLPEGQPVSGRSIVSEDTIRMTLADWEQVAQRLRSASALIDYVTRILAGSIDVELGQERYRYEAIAAADLAASPNFPSVLADQLNDDDLMCVEQIEDWIHRDLVPFYGRDSSVARAAIEAIDQMPLSVRVAIGRKVLELYERALSDRRWVSTMIRSVQGGPRIVAVTDLAENYDDPDVFATRATMLGLVRHEMLYDADPSATLLLARLSHGRGAFRTVGYFAGDVSDELTPEMRYEVLISTGYSGLRGGGEVRDLFASAEGCPCRGGHSFGVCEFDWSL